MSNQVVQHPKYGSGIVKFAHNNGYILLVTFQDGVSRWVKLTELLQNKTPQKLDETQKTPDFSDERFKFRRMIEAFRLGIVPYDCLTDFTFGRDQEIDQIRKWLDSDESGSLFIVGEYGTGKTHLLHYSLSYALKNNFAVAWVEMDPNEVPFYNPKRVYRKLLKEFKYYDRNSDQIKNFRDFIKNVVSQNILMDNKFIQHMRNNLYEENFWHWIEGEDINKISQVPTLYKSFTSANIYCYLLSSFGWAVTQLGLRGLFIVFDEAETIAMNNHFYQDEKSKNFIKSLLRTANNDKKLLNNPSSTGLNYCGMGEGPSIPFLYKENSGLKLLFAFTTLDWNFEHNWADFYKRTTTISEVDNTSKLNLSHLSLEDLRIVFDHLCELYMKAYGFQCKSNDAHKAFGKLIDKNVRQTRLFVKGCVEIFDLLRLG